MRPLFARMAWSTHARFGGSIWRITSNVVQHRARREKSGSGVPFQKKAPFARRSCRKVPCRLLLERAYAGTARRARYPASIVDGRSPKCPAKPPAIRLAMKASDTIFEPYRSNRLALVRRASCSTRRLAWPSWRNKPVRSVSSAASAESYRLSAPLADRSSSRSAGMQSGSRWIERRTSRQITLPVPSQMPLSGASR
jgi:hypothetical protein